MMDDSSSNLSFTERSPNSLGINTIHDDASVSFLDSHHMHADVALRSSRLPTNDEIWACLSRLLTSPNASLYTSRNRIITYLSNFFGVDLRVKKDWITRAIRQVLDNIQLSNSEFYINNPHVCVSMDERASTSQTLEQNTTTSSCSPLPVPQAHLCSSGLSPIDTHSSVLWLLSPRTYPLQQLLTLPKSRLIVTLLAASVKYSQQRKHTHIHTPPTMSGDVVGSSRVPAATLKARRGRSRPLSSPLPPCSTSPSSTSSSSSSSSFPSSPCPCLLRDPWPQTHRLALTDANARSLARITRATELEAQLSLIHSVREAFLDTPLHVLSAGKQNGSQNSGNFSCDHRNRNCEGGSRGDIGFAIPSQQLLTKNYTCLPDSLYSTAIQKVLSGDCDMAFLEQLRASYLAYRHAMPNTHIFAEAPALSSFRFLNLPAQPTLRRYAEAVHQVLMYALPKPYRCVKALRELPPRIKGPAVAVCATASDLCAWIVEYAELAGLVRTCACEKRQFSHDDSNVAEVNMSSPASLSCSSSTAALLASPAHASHTYVILDILLAHTLALPLHFSLPLADLHHYARACLMLPVTDGANAGGTSRQVDGKVASTSRGVINTIGRGNGEGSGDGEDGDNAWSAEGRELLHRLLGKDATKAHTEHVGGSTDKNVMLGGCSEDHGGCQVQEAEEEQEQEEAQAGEGERGEEPTSGTLGVVGDKVISSTSSSRLSSSLALPRDTVYAFMCAAKAHRCLYTATAVATAFLAHNMIQEKWVSGKLNAKVPGLRDDFRRGYIVYGAGSQSGAVTGTAAGAHCNVNTSAHMTDYSFNTSVDMNVSVNTAYDDNYNVTIVGTSVDNLDDSAADGIPDSGSGGSLHPPLPTTATSAIHQHTAPRPAVYTGVDCASIASGSDMINDKHRANESYIACGDLWNASTLAGNLTIVNDTTFGVLNGHPTTDKTGPIAPTGVGGAITTDSAIASGIDAPPMINANAVVCTTATTAAAGTTTGDMSSPADSLGAPPSARSLRAYSAAVFGTEYTQHSVAAPSSHNASPSPHPRDMPHPESTSLARPPICAQEHGDACMPGFPRGHDILHLVDTTRVSTLFDEQAVREALATKSKMGKRTGKDGNSGDGARNLDSSSEFVVFSDSDGISEAAEGKTSRGSKRAPKKSNTSGKTKNQKGAVPKSCVTRRRTRATAPISDTDDCLPSPTNSPRTLARALLSLLLPREAGARLLALGHAPRPAEPWGVGWSDVDGVRTMGRARDATDHEMQLLAQSSDAGTGTGMGTGVGMGTGLGLGMGKGTAAPVTSSPPSPLILTRLLNSTYWSSDLCRRTYMHARACRHALETRRRLCRWVALYRRAEGALRRQGHVITCKPVFAPTTGARARATINTQDDKHAITGALHITSIDVSSKSATNVRTKTTHTKAVAGTPTKESAGALRVSGRHIGLPFPLTAAMEQSLRSPHRWQSMTMRGTRPVGALHVMSGSWETAQKRAIAMLMHILRDRLSGRQYQRPTTGNKAQIDVPVASMGDANVDTIMEGRTSSVIDDDDDSDLFSEESGDDYSTDTSTHNMSLQILSESINIPNLATDLPDKVLDYFLEAADEVHVDAIQQMLPALPDETTPLPPEFIYVNQIGYGNVPMAINAPGEMAGPIIQRVTEIIREFGDMSDQLWARISKTIAKKVEKVKKQHTDTENIKTVPVVNDSSIRKRKSPSIDEQPSSKTERISTPRRQRSKSIRD